MLLTPDKIPARMLNEFSYCPRLCWLEWHDSLFVDSPDTIDGRHVHRRVDRPDAADIAPPDSSSRLPKKSAEETTESPAGPTLHARSLLLGSETEGLIAQIDLVEIDGLSATPVDYKRGKAPEIPEGAYEPERVQLAAQCLILRENGYTCTRGVLYFAASKTRVEIPFTPELLERARELGRLCRELFAQGRMPLPLVDSPKCPRCSLVGICLPDETSHLLNPQPGNPEETIRRLFPIRDDAYPLHVQSQGGTIGKTGERLVVRPRDEPPREVRLMDISMVCLHGNVQITTQAVRECLMADIPILYFTVGYWFLGHLMGTGSKNIFLRIAQHQSAQDPHHALRLARALVLAKLRNQRTLLRRNAETDPTGTLTRLQDLIDQVDHPTRVASLATLMGLEGTGARLYFAAFSNLLKSADPSFAFEDRNRRPPRDPVNALLSFGYSLLTRECLVAAISVGLDPYLGFLHQPHYGRPSLALDLMEEFRPLVVDSMVLNLVNTMEIQPRHFLRRAGACVLNEPGRKVVLLAYERRMDTLVTHPLLGYRATYRRMLEVQARLLGRELVGELPTYTGFITR